MKKKNISIGFSFCAGLLICLILFLLIDKVEESADTTTEVNTQKTTSFSSDSQSNSTGNSSENASSIIDYKNIRILFAVDNTKSMKGYAADPQYINLLKILERHLSDFQKKETILVPTTSKDSKEKKEYLKWQEYNYDEKGLVGVSAVKTESDFYCKGEYENQNNGPIHLLLKDEYAVGAFSENTVNVLVTDFHEQGGALYSLGEEIRKTCEENLGPKSDYAAAILAFNFAFKGYAYITDPEDPTHSLKKKMEPPKDTKPLYVVIAGQADGVRHYCDFLRQDLAEENIVYHQIDNIERFNESDSILNLVPERKAVQQDFSDENKKDKLLTIAQKHLVGLMPLDPVQNGFSEENTLVYAMDNDSVSLPEFRNLFDGFANWICSYEFEDTGSDFTKYAVMVTKSPPYEVEFFNPDQKCWEAFTETSCAPQNFPLEITANENLLRITMGGKSLIADDDRVYLNKCDLKITFHVECVLQRLDSSTEWIDNYDLNYDPSIPEEELFTKTLDLSTFCRGLLGIKTKGSMNEYDIEPYKKDFIIVLKGMKNF